MSNLRRVAIVRFKISDMHRLLTGAVRVNPADMPPDCVVVSYEEEHLLEGAPYRIIRNARHNAMGPSIECRSSPGLLIDTEDAPSYSRLKVMIQSPGLPEVPDGTPAPSWMSPRLIENK